ncbi:MAG: histidine phosphatase family protein [Burkholderiaceae bacterium]
MKIILMRHGKPVLAETGWIPPADMAHWIAQYDLSEVSQQYVPVGSLMLADSVTMIVSSTARRALSSVQALGKNASVTDPVFCEAQLPFCLWRFPLLPPVVWSAFFRVLWFFGYSRGAESIRTARTRAREAAHKLITLAEKGPILLVGHEIMNRFIATELIALGWSSPSKQESEYWSTSVLGFQT